MFLTTNQEFHFVLPGSFNIVVNLLKNRLPSVRHIGAVPQMYSCHTTGNRAGQYPAKNSPLVNSADSGRSGSLRPGPRYAAGKDTMCINAENEQSRAMNRSRRTDNNLPALHQNGPENGNGVQQAPSPLLLCVPHSNHHFRPAIVRSLPPGRVIRGGDT